MYGMFLSGVSKSVMQMNLERSSDILFFGGSRVYRRRAREAVLRGMMKETTTRGGTPPRGGAEGCFPG